jgi:broad specificity phosphatase PhoE
MREDVACVTSEAMYFATDEVEAYGEIRSVASWASCSGHTVRSLRKRLSELATLPAEIALAAPSYVRIDPTALPGQPRSWTWDLLPWEDDEWAQEWVARHPGGGTLEEVGAALGVVRERVRQVEESAMAKFRREARRAGVPVRILLQALGEMRSQLDRGGTP